MASLGAIEGIGPTHGAKLAKAGLRTTDGLLAAAGTAKGRTAIAKQTGISDKLILEWVNHADLFRINGVAGEYADLLEAAGVDTVVELAQRSAANLHAKLREVNAERRLVRALPGESQVARWIEHAKSLERAVHH